jgi:tetraacyldisaccharide-1-P 4'-kinase
LINIKKYKNNRIKTKKERRCLPKGKLRRVIERKQQRAAKITSQREVTERIKMFNNLS